MSDRIRRKVKAAGPNLIMFYGPPGVGKTSAALSFPQSLLIPIEEGIPRTDVRGKPLEVDAFDQPQSYQELLSMLAEVEEMGGQEFKTLILDSADRLELLLQRFVCEMNGWGSIEVPEYGKGYLAAATEWHAFIQLLRRISKNTGMNIIIVAHSDAVTAKPPGMEPYHQYAPRLHKKAAEIVCDECDIIGFLNHNIAIKQVDAGFGKKDNVAVGGESRLLQLENRASAIAKNRNGMPSTIAINPKQDVFPLLEQYL